MKEVRVALAGTGGYGRYYLRTLMKDAAAHGARLAAGIDPRPHPDSAQMLKETGIPLLASLADLAPDSADLVIIAAPIHLHAPLSCQAMEQGFPVLCEKPLAGSVADGLSVIRASRATGRFAAIGYQWSYSDAVQSAKRDIVSGRFGRPVRMRTICIWPRRKSYYTRTFWAGRMTLPDGSFVHDSPANNAAAHYLHNMFFLAGEEMGKSAVPKEVTAELYRCKEIESYDTVVIRCLTGNGVEILFVATHSAKPECGPVFELAFEKATFTYDADKDPFLRAHLPDGSVVDYNDPDATYGNRLWHTVEAARTGKTPACDALAAFSQTVCVCAALESSGIFSLPPEQVVTKTDGLGDGFTWMPALSDTLWECYRRWALPSETKADWARAGATVRVTLPEGAQ